MTNTKDQILDAAMHVFADRGFAGTTTRAITDRAGVRLGLLAYHWGTKQALWEAVLTQLNRRLLQVAEGAVQPGLSLAEGVQAFLGQILPELLADPRPLRVMAWASMAPEGFDRDVVQQAYLPAIRLGTELLEAQQAAGAIPAGIDVPLTLVTFYGLVAEPILEPSVHQELFAATHHDAAHAARLTKHLTHSALLLLGLSHPGASS